MKAAWETPEMHAELSSKSQKERNHSKILGIGERIILK
jgi:hypothetical protein